MDDKFLVERGVALSGMENRRNEKYLPGKANTDYFVHEEAAYKYFSEKGFTFIRLAFLWERLQPALFGDLEKTHLQYLKDAADLAQKYGMRILPEPHSYGGRLVDGVNYKLGTDKLPIAAFADFWGKVAKELKDHPGVLGYDLMNEPESMPVSSNANTYHPTIGGKTEILNGDLKSGDAGWSYDKDFTFSTGKITQKSAGGWSNLTTLNKVGSGIKVKPGSNNKITFKYEQKVTKGGKVRVRVAYGKDSAYGKEILGKVLDPTSDPTEVVLEFKAPSDCNMVWIRFQNQDGTVDATYSDFKLESDGESVKEIATMTLANQAAIDAIRKAGSKQWIILEFDRYTGLAQFTNNFGTNPTIWWKDPLNKTVPSFHYYHDPDYSGTYDVPFEQKCMDRVEPEAKIVFDWAKKNKVQVLVAEYGVPSDSSESSKKYRETLDKLLTVMDSYNVHGCYWAAGRGYVSKPTIHPTNKYKTDREVMKVAVKHLSKPHPKDEEPVTPTPAPTPAPSPAPSPTPAPSPAPSPEPEPQAKLPSYDFTDKSKMFQDLEGKIPAEVNKRVALVLCSAGTDYKMIQDVERCQPVLKEDGLYFDGGASQLRSSKPVDFSGIPSFVIETEVTKGYSSKTGIIVELGKATAKGFALTSPWSSYSVYWTAQGEVIATTSSAYAAPNTLKISLDTDGPLKIDEKNISNAKGKVFGSDILYIGRREGTGSGFKGTIKYINLKTKD
jgi:hypothetical protein